MTGRGKLPRSAGGGRSDVQEGALAVDENIRSEDVFLVEEALVVHEDCDPIGDHLHRSIRAFRKALERAQAQARTLALHDSARLMGARRQIVDAVVNTQLRIDRLNQVECQRRRQERPDDRPRESDSAHPSPQRVQHRVAVDPACHARVRKWDDDGRVDEKVLALLAKAVRAAPPVAQPLAHP